MALICLPISAITPAVLASAGLSAPTACISSWIATVGMVDLPLRDQIVQCLRRAILHLVNVDTGVEQEPLPPIRLALTNGSSFVASPAPVSFANRTVPNVARVEIERRTSEASFSPDRPCLGLS